MLKSERGSGVWVEKAADLRTALSQTARSCRRVYKPFENISNCIFLEENRVPQDEGEELGKNQNSFLNIREMLGIVKEG